MEVLSDPLHETLQGTNATSSGGRHVGLTRPHRGASGQVSLFKAPRVPWNRCHPLQRETQPVSPHLSTRWTGNLENL